MHSYPSKAEMKAIKNFVGTPREFVEYIGSIWSGNGRADETDGGELVATFVTGGWSGCEEVISVVQGTLFSFTFHSKWMRGGLWEYRITPGLIDVKMEWGTQFKKKKKKKKKKKRKSKPVIEEQ